MNFLQNLKIFFTSNKKQILYAGLFVIFMVLSVDSVFAADESVITNEVLGLFNSLIAIAAGFSALLTLFTQIFLDPSWVNGSFLGLDIQLKNMWIMMSNVVYTVFAFLFVWIAIMNIVGRDEDTYKLKQAIPKFIVGVLIVPFSWFFVQMIVSVSSVLTTAVLTIPYNDFKDAGISDKKVRVCEKGYKVDMYATGSGIVKCSDGEDLKLVSIDQWLQDKKNIFGIMTIYTYSVMKVDNNGKLFATELDKVKKLTDLALKTIIDIIFLIAFFLLMIALVLALITRGFYVWIYMMFSPVFGLLYFFGKGGEGMGDGASKNFNIKEFIALAMVPVYVSGALVFGFIFLSAANKGMEDSAATFKITQNTDELQIGNLTIQGKAGTTEGNTEESKSSEFFNNLSNSLGSVFLQLMGIVIMWLAVMAALRQSEITKSVVEPIAQFGGSIGELIKSAPKYAPIIPAPGGGMMNAKGLEKIGGTIASIPDIRTNNQVAGINQKIQNLFGGKTVPVEIMNDFKAKTGNGIERMDEFNALRSQYLSMVEQYGHNDTNVMKLREILVDALKSSNLGGDVKRYANSEMQVANLNNLTTELTDNNTNKILTGTLGGQKLINFQESKVAGSIKASDYGFTSATESGTASSTIPTGITKNGDKIIINHFSGKEGETPINLTLKDNKVNVTELTDVLNDDKNGYKGNIKKEDLRNMLNKFMDDEEITTFMTNLGETFFKTNP